MSKTDNIHRYDSIDRKHYIFEKRYSLRLNPHLLYAGELNKSDAWREEPHAHEFCELLFIVEGNGTITANGKQKPFKRGDIVIYDPGVEHFEQSRGKDAILIYFFAVDMFKITDLQEGHLMPPGYDFIYNTGERFDEFLTMFKNIIYECKHTKAFFGEIASCLAKVTMLGVLRTANRTENELSKNNKTVEKAVEYINNNYSKNISLETVAEQCYVDKYHLSHMFTKALGVSVGKFIKDLKIAKAKRLLETTSYTVSVIAEKTGFDDSSYFSRMFKSAVGCSPLQYRRRSQC